MKGGDDDEEEEEKQEEEEEKSCFRKEGKCDETTKMLEPAVLFSFFFPRLLRKKN